MESAFDETNYQLLKERIYHLREDSFPRWGKMNAGEMLCHISDSMREALGLRPTTSISTPISRTIAKWISFYLLNTWPKGRFSTSPEYDVKLKGTRPSNFDLDQKETLRLLSVMKNQPEWHRFHAHPLFGKMTRKEWGVLLTKHFDHHLRQFGV